MASFWGSVGSLWHPVGSLLNRSRYIAGCILNELILFLTESHAYWHLLRRTCNPPIHSLPQLGEYFIYLFIYYLFICCGPHILTSSRFWETCSRLWQTCSLFSSPTKLYSEEVERQWKTLNNQFEKRFARDTILWATISTNQ